MKTFSAFVTAIVVFSSFSEVASAQPSLTVKYLAGGWVEPEGDCSAEWGPNFQYTAEGEIVFEDDREPYRIVGNRIYFVNPMDGAETYDEAMPLDDDTMRLRQQNSEWVVLHRCGEHSPT